MQTTILPTGKNSFRFKRQTKIKMFLALVVGAAFLSGMGGAIADGEAIFKQRCAVCHSIGGGRSVGPDLEGVHTKRLEVWLIQITRSAQSFVNSGDAEAKKLLDEYKMMPDQDLSDADIEAVLD